MTVVKNIHSARGRIIWFEASRCVCDTFLACGGTFVCPTCKREVGHCLGGSEGDEKLDAMCVDCWAARQA